MITGFLSVCISLSVVKYMKLFDSICAVTQVSLMHTASVIKKGVYFWIMTFVVHIIYSLRGKINFYVLHHIKACIHFRQVVWQQQDKNIHKTCCMPNFAAYFLC